MLIFGLFEFLVAGPWIAVLGNSTRSKSGNPRSLTILGLRQAALPLKKTSFFSDKKEIQRSAAALGYVSQASSFFV
ncbi:hypothetical protein BVC80_8805g13 [Macleaya cordata]|uniref:Uncharacterized protein n=1 Tax=Macleaya cordata TaxID=56857 RepID=A0A200R826_MACCD|nr:hypothetical protein BVC80_8805g13 [Macleaya cordata]